MVKKYRTLAASEAQVRQFASKAQQFRKAMQLAYDSELWDAAVSNGVHAVILMANALTGRRAGVYYADKDHSQAPEYLKQIFGPEASSAKEQMAQVLSLMNIIDQPVTPLPEIHEKNVEIITRTPAAPATAPTMGAAG